MARIIWKKDDLVNLKIRDNLCTIGQLLVSPFMRFFDIRNTSENWESCKLDDVQELFTVLVVNQVFRELAVGKIKGKLIVPSTKPLERKWIVVNNSLERLAAGGLLYFGGKLVELGEDCSPFRAKALIEDLRFPQNQEIMEKYELSNMWSADSLKERLCRYFDTGIDRDDLKFEVFPELYDDKEKLRPLTSRLPIPYR